MKHVFAFALAVILIFSLAACDESQPDYERMYESLADEYESMYESRYEDGFVDGRSDGYWEGYYDAAGEIFNEVSSVWGYCVEDFMFEYEQGYWGDSKEALEYVLGQLEEIQSIVSNYY